MKRRRIWLHAGMHKTGTTSIQKYLFDHAAALRRRGYGVVTDIDFGPLRAMAAPESTNCLRLAHLFLRDDFGSPVKLRARLRRYGLGRRLGGLVRLRRCLHRIDCSDIVISAEALSFLRNPRERLWLGIAFQGFDVVSVIFFRERGAWLASWERQMGGLRRKLEKEGRLVDGSPDGYSAHALDFGADSPLVDYPAIRRFFGDGIYLDYDTAVRDAGSAVPVFLAAIGIDPDDMPTHEAYWDNRSADKRDFSRPADQ